MHTKQLITYTSGCMAAIALFVTGYQFVHAQALAHCHQINSTAEFPQTDDFGVPYNIFSAATENLIVIICNDPASTVHIGYEQNNHYIFEEGYLWRNNAWVKQGLSGRVKDRNWLVGKATGTMATTSAELGQTNYFVSYICHRIGDNWQCGCQTNTNCIDNRWSIQQFSGAPVGTPAPNITLMVDTLNVPSGGSVQITWSATDAQTCLAYGDWEGDLPAQGSRVINGITANKKYQLQCDGPGGSAIALQQVYVQ